MDTTIKIERKSRQFWAIDDFWTVSLVTAFECPPSEDVFWVPSLGYSLTVGHHLFETDAEARSVAIKKLESNISDLQKALTRLRVESSVETSEAKQ